MAAAAAAAVVITVAACGPVQLGAAEVTSDQSIPASTLTSEVANLQAAYKASGGKIPLQFPASQEPQQVLAWMVRFQIRDRLASGEGITVTRAQSQKALASLSAQAKGGGTTLKDEAVANGLPPDMLGQLGRFEAIQLDLLRKLNGGAPLPTSSTAQQSLSKQFDHQQCLAAKNMNIKINPQYGRLNYSQLSVVPAAETLSAPSGTPSPQSTAGATPPC